MTIYGQPLNQDSNGVKTSAKYGDPGTGINEWSQTVTVAGGSIEVTTGGAGEIDDPAVTDPTSDGSIISLLKGLLTNLRVAAAGLMKAEDEAHTSGDAGVMSLSVRRDSVAAESSTTGDYQPLVSNSVGSLRVTPHTPITNVTTTAYADSLVVKASSGRLFGISGFNSLTTPQFIQVHNAATLPADTAVPAVLFYVPGLTSFSADFGPLGRPFSTGIVICNSTSGPTKTIGLADCWFDAQYD